MEARADFRRGGVLLNNEELSISSGCDFVASLATQIYANKVATSCFRLGKPSDLSLSHTAIAGLSVHEAELECAIVTDGLH